MKTTERIRAKMPQRVRRIRPTEWVAIGLCLALLSLLIWFMNYDEQRKQNQVRDSLQRQGYSVVDVVSRDKVIIRTASGQSVEAKVLEGPTGEWIPSSLCPMETSGLISGMNCVSPWSRFYP